MNLFIKSLIDSVPVISTWIKSIKLKHFPRTHKAYINDDKPAKANLDCVDTEFIVDDFNVLGCYNWHGSEMNKKNS